MFHAKRPRKLHYDLITIVNVSKCGHSGKRLIGIKEVVVHSAMYSEYALVYTSDSVTIFVSTTNKLHFRIEMETVSVRRGDSKFSLKIFRCNETLKWHINRQVKLWKRWLFIGSAQSDIVLRVRLFWHTRPSRSNGIHIAHFSNFSRNLYEAVIERRVTARINPLHCLSLTRQKFFIFFHGLNTPLWCNSV